MTQTSSNRSPVRIPGMHGVWRRLSRVGEKFGWDWLIYNPGIFQSFHAAALKNAPLFTPVVLKEFPGVRTFVDVGCGTGGFAAEFQRRGLKVVGFEYSPRGREWAKRTGIDVRPFDVSISDSADLGGERVDLVLTTEVAEHVPPFLADAFVRFVASCGDNIVFTACPPNDHGRGNGHINEQPKSYWIEKFEKLGYRVDQAKTDRIVNALKATDVSYYMHENLIVFEKARD
ncbi:MAG: class I SAM-dependent methyltransferase [Pyrinomonadaceae bacterium]|nr:class I SAM-dependent methyltransferase [Phycisphaerales bacterium]